MEKRAIARYRDKMRTSGPERLQIDQTEFVNWYCSQEDCCHYCRLTMAEVKRLRLKRGGFGHFVSWDIDRKDSSLPYKAGNLALSCFLCNMAKGSLLTEEEAMMLGKAVRAIYRRRLQSLGLSPLQSSS